MCCRTRGSWRLRHSSWPGLPPKPLPSAFCPPHSPRSCWRSHGRPALALRALLTGGDTLHRSPREALPFAVVNHYGPTENTVVTTWAPVSPDREATALPPIGRPIANTQVYLLDQALQPVPIGVPGELCIGGDGLARGYLHRPVLTAEKFIPHPFSQEPGARLYKTGDLARYRPDGNIEFMGRLDQQVKIRGFRVELGEIEAVLGQHTDVRETVVLAREDRPGDKRLVAYVVPKMGQALTSEMLRDSLTKKLPAYMIPAAFVVMQALPLNPNGKLDRQALPEPDLTGSTADTSLQTPIEEMVAGIWAEVLGLPDGIGRHDNFFALGGHSLSAIQVGSRLRDTLGVELPLHRLFDQPTVAALASFVEHRRQQDVVPREAPPLRPASREQPVPLSFAQQRLWFLDQLEPHSAFYNILRALRLRGSLKIHILKQALDAILQRHEALRTRFRGR